MSGNSVGLTWAEIDLVGFGPDVSKTIPIAGDLFTIGRSKSCSLRADTKLISAIHCDLSSVDGHVYLNDRSANGCVVNGTRRLKNDRCELQDGDVVHLVRRKSHPEEDVLFTIRLPKPRVEPTEEQLDNTLQNPTLAATLAVDALHDDAGLTQPIEEPPPKVRRLIDCDEEVQPSTITKQGSGVSSSTIDTELASRSAVPKPAAAESPSTDENLTQNMQCSICMEVIHDCVSLQPCMHSFCAGCYSDWMAKSLHCPECRGKVDRISKNHLVNNIIQAYLKNHPAQRRSDSDLKDLDAKNKITADMLYPKRKHRSEEQGSDQDDDDYSDEDDSSTDEDSQDVVQNIHPGIFLGMLGGMPQAAPVTRCRQCPQTTWKAPPAGANAVPLPVPPRFVCAANQDHMLCQCCFEPIPNRAGEVGVHLLPPVKCTACHKVYCHMYWGCTRYGCSGCLNKFSDLLFGDQCWNGLLSNAYESKVLQDYMKAKNLNLHDLLTACLAKMQEGAYSVNRPMLGYVSAASVVCFTCGLSILRDLAYCFRRDIKKEELPPQVSRRSDCYWGRNCRTQTHNVQHAERFNHICEQTRFT